jgi:capsular polysaccharide transport system permease protein
MGALRVQWRVVHALLLREVITRFGRRNLGVLWLIAEPMVFTVGVALLWSAAGLGERSGLPIFAFAVTGYTSVLMWRNTVGRCNYAILQNLSLLYHRNVKVIDLLWTRIILEVAGATGSFLILTTGLVWLEKTPLPEDPLKVIAGLALLAWFSAGLGLVIGAAASLSELVDRVWHPAAYILLPLSGAAFMVDWLPPAAQEVVMLLPMVHCLELLREGYFGRFVVTHHDIPYVIVFCMLLTLVGLFLTRVASRRVEGL